MPQPTMDTGVMTQTLEAILGVFEAGAGAVQSGGAGLLSTLIAIEIVWGGIMWVWLDAQPALRQFVRKMVLVGVFAYLVLNWVSVANIILEGFVWAGGEVGGRGSSLGVIRNPSQILDQGIEATAVIWEAVGELSVMDSGFFPVLMTALISLVILVLYFLIAIQIYMTLLEFYIIVAFGTVFIPWGVNSHTKWIAERYLGAIVAQGTKLMVIVAMLGVLYPILASLTLGPDWTFYDVLSLLFGVATITFVVWRAPNVAGGLMSGSASLSASDAIGTVAAGAGAAAGVASGAATTVASGGTLAAEGVRQAATGAISAASKVTNKSND